MRNPFHQNVLSAKHILLLILLLAAVFRIFGLSQESLWLDEGFTARRAGSTFLDLASEFHHQTQSALYYVGIKLWSMVFGMSEVSLRFPSALFGIAAVFVIFLLARQIFSERVGLWSAFLLAVNPFAIFYSQEARPYALLMLAVTFSLHCLLLLRWKYSRPWLWGYLISTLIALYSHPISPLVLGLELFVVFLYWQSTPDQRPVTPVRYPLMAIGIAGLLYLPQVIFMWQTLANKIQGGSGSADWIQRPDVSAMVHTIGDYFMASRMLTFVELTILCALVIRPYPDRRFARGLIFMLATVACFIGGLWIISRTITPVYVGRYTIPALPAVLILLAWAMAKFSWFMRLPALAIFLGLTVNSLYGYYSGSDKDPYREAAAVVRSQVQSGDAIVLHAIYTRDVFGYYFHAPDRVRVIAPLTVDEIPADINSAKRIFVVRSYGRQAHACSDSLLNRITENYVSGKPITIRGWAEPNPKAYWIANISVTPYYSSITDPEDGSRQ